MRHFLVFSIFFTGLLFASIPLSASAGVLYVSTTGVDQYFDLSWNRCTSRYAPCAKIAHALSRASDGDDIQLETGTYLENAIQINKAITGLRILGGYGSQFLSRVTDPSLTVISGNRAHRIFQIDAIGISVSVSFDNLWLGYGTADRGGAVWVLSESGGRADVSFDKVRFTDNRARYDGGAVYAVNAPGAGNGLSLSFTGCALSGNQAWGTTGAILGGYGYGGAISLRTYSTGAPGATLFLSENRFSTNEATKAGSAVYLHSQNSGAALDAEFEKNFVLTGQKSNFSLGAVEVHADAGSVDLTFENNRVVDNQNRGILINAWAGGSITSSHTNDTISGNQGEGIYAQGSSGSGATVDVDLLNTIVWGNSGSKDIYLDGTVLVGAEYSDIGSVTTANLATYLPQPSVFDADPLFAPSFYRLSSSSPAKDTGICWKIICTTHPPLPQLCLKTRFAPFDDFEGDPRPSGTTCDVGADEYVPEPASILLSLASLCTLGLLKARRRNHCIM